MQIHQSLQMHDKSFPSSYRLLKSKEFDEVFDNREYAVSNGSLLILAIRNQLGFNRLGVIVGRKSLRRAVDRNYIKRQLRETFRHLKPLSLDVVALVRPGLCLQTQVRDTVTESFDNLQQKADGSD